MLFAIWVPSFSWFEVDVHVRLQIEDQRQDENRTGDGTPSWNPASRAQPNSSPLYKMRGWVICDLLSGPVKASFAGSNQSAQ
jgi:hypothetical protein